MGERNIKIIKHMKLITGLFSSFLLLAKLTTLSANAEEIEEITEFLTEPEILTQDYDGQTILLPLAEHAEELETNIVYDENGNAYILHEGKRVTGKFYLVPEYSKGDILQDNKINAEDASYILYAAAIAGADSLDATEVLLHQQENYTTGYQILQLADVNNDNTVNAADAAEILSYASAYGSGQNPLPFGIVCYQTDENGVLQKG
ncbi:MAG: dockerin type I repeat-containing protein [Oscillospiraceae bacterium]|nr:dockerin type I repeat-containing protein [Oscillospiraceae bacterium]